MIQNWCDGKRTGHRRNSDEPVSRLNFLINQPPCETYAGKYKHGKYAKDFKGSDYLFARAQLVLRPPMASTVNLASRE